MTEMELLADLHRHQPRQGPGSNDDTLRALALCKLDTGAELQIHGGRMAERSYAARTNRLRTPADAVAALEDGTERG